MRNFMNIRTIFLLSTLALSTGCSHLPYRIDVDQGNIINQQDLSRISLGMSKAQVQQALGSSLLNDTFHRNRWDYVQYYKSGRSQTAQEGKVSLFFSNGLLSHIQAEEIIQLETQPVPYRKSHYRPDGTEDEAAITEIYNQNSASETTEPVIRSEVETLVDETVIDINEPSTIAPAPSK